MKWFYAVRKIIDWHNSDTEEYPLIKSDIFTIVNYRHKYTLLKAVVICISKPKFSKIETSKTIKMNEYETFSVGLALSRKQFQILAT